MDSRPFRESKEERNLAGQSEYWFAGLNKAKNCDLMEFRGESLALY